MTDLIFEVREDPEVGTTARAFSASVFTEADTLDELKQNVRDWVAGVKRAQLPNTSLCTCQPVCTPVPEEHACAHGELLMFQAQTGVCSSNQTAQEISPDLRPDGQAD